MWQLHTPAPCSSGSHNGRIYLRKQPAVRPHGRIQCLAGITSSSSSSTDRSLAFGYTTPAAAAPRSYLHQQQQQSSQSVWLRATPGMGPCLALLAIAAALGPPLSPTASHSCPLPTGLGDDELDVAVFRFTLGIPGFDDSNIPRVVGTVVAAAVAINHVISYGSNPAPPAQVGGWTAGRGGHACSSAWVDPGTAVLWLLECASSLSPSAFAFPGTTGLLAPPIPHILFARLSWLAPWRTELSSAATNVSTPKNYAGPWRVPGRDAGSAVCCRTRDRAAAAAGGARPGPRRCWAGEGRGTGVCPG